MGILQSLVVFLGLTLISLQVLAIDIVISGQGGNKDWAPNQLVPLQVAGVFDVGTSQTSSSSEVSLAISGTAGLSSGTYCGITGLTWAVYGYVSDPAGEGYSIQVRQTNIGSGDAGSSFEPFNSGSYQVLSNNSSSPTLLFCGKGDRSSIDMQYELRDFKISGGSGQNIATVYYKVVSN